jgi:hypothetical protein
VAQLLHLTAETRSVLEPHCNNVDQRDGRDALDKLAAQKCEK